MLAKDVRQELRSRTALSTQLLFAFTTVAVVSYAFRNTAIGPPLLGALVWILVLFAGLSGLAHAFVREEETGTALLLRLTADATAIYLGKLVFNLLLLGLITLTVFTLVLTLFPSDIGDLLGLLLLAGGGTVALSAGTTLVAAIIARAASRGALLGVLTLPLIIVPLLSLVSGTTKLLVGEGTSDILGELQVVLSYSVVMITASLMLFRFVWED